MQHTNPVKRIQTHTQVLSFFLSLNTLYFQPFLLSPDLMITQTNKITYFLLSLPSKLLVLYYDIYTDIKCKLIKLHTPSGQGCTNIQICTRAVIHTLTLTQGIIHNPWPFSTTPEAEYLFGSITASFSGTSLINHELDPQKALSRTLRTKHKGLTLA